MPTLLAFPRGAALAAGELPTASQKRKLLYSRELTADEAVAIGRRLLGAEHYSDALSFFEKAGRPEEIAALATTAIENGDLFLYEASCKSRTEELRPAELLRLAEKALATGKLQYARRAFQLAGDEARSQEVAVRIAELIAPPKPEGSAPALEPAKDMDFDE